MSGLSAISCPSGFLAPGASETCTGTYTTTQADVDAGSISNTGKATGTLLSGSNVVATSSVTIPASDTPSISVVKSASVVSFSTAGTVVTYTYKVTNTGNVDLNPVTVADPMGGLSAMTCSATVLAPTASLTCTATYTTTAADVTKGSISNTATATGKPQVGTSATSTLTIPYVVPPNLTITASTTSVSVVQGNATSSPITTTVSGGFNSPVSLSASGQPTGVTVSFNPTSIAAPGSGSSTMSITVGPTVAPGTYPITVTGTGAAIVHSTTVTLTAVASTSTLQLSITPASVAFGTVRRGGVGGKTVTVKNTGAGAVGIRNVTIPPHAGGDAIVPLNLCPATLAAGRSCTIDIGLLVTATGHVTATLVITDNAAGSPQMVPISVN